MSIDERLEQAMRAAANGIDPPVSDLVAGGVARGRRNRRRRTLRTVGGVLAAVVVTTAGALVVPDMLADSAEVAGGVDAADGVDEEPASEVAEPERTPLEINETGASVSEAELQRLFADVVALTNGTLATETQDEAAGQPAASHIKLEFDGGVTAEVIAYNARPLLENHDPCGGGGTECEPLLNTELAEVAHHTTPRGAFLIYRTKSPNATSQASDDSELLVRVDVPQLPEGTSLADLGFGDGAELRDAILGAVPDAEVADREALGAEEVDQVAVAVANLSTATSGELARGFPGDATEGTVVAGRVLVDGADAFDLTVSYHETMDVQAWRDSCRPGDGKPCVERFSTNDTALLVTTYATHAGRETVRYIADLPEGSLSVTFNNYLETESGEKIVGPSWAEAGVDPDELAAAVEASGLRD